MSQFHESLATSAKEAISAGGMTVEVYTQATEWIEISDIAVGTNLDVRVLTPTRDADQRVYVPVFDIKGVRVTKPSSGGFVSFM